MKGRVYYELMNYEFEREMREAICSTLEDIVDISFKSKEEIILLIASCYCLLAAFSFRDEWEISAHSAIRLKQLFKDVIEKMSLHRFSDAMYIEKCLIRYCKFLIKLN